MTTGSHRRKIFAAAALSLTLSACAATYRNHGYAPDEDQLSQIDVGVSTRQDVADIVGRPSATGVLQDAGWFYVQSQFRHYAYNAPEEIDREVVAISFSNDVVSNVERFGLEDGQVVALSRRVTDDGIRNVSFLRQLLGSLGQVDADSLFSDAGTSPF